jgi:hypothetical protein
MALQLKYLYVHFDLWDKVIVYVKDEGANLNTLTNALINIISRVPLFIVKTICY